MAIREAQPGTVSHGTMRNVDLIPAFLEVLQQCNSPAWEQLQMQPHPLPPSYALEDPGSDWWHSEEADYFVEELFDALDACAPEGHYFGAHPGDGSDFGFWPSEEYEGNAPTSWERYWTVLVPYSEERRTKWHPTERFGPFAVLSRGAFPTPEEAHAWAKAHLEGQPYTLREIDNREVFAAEAEAKALIGAQVTFLWEDRELLGDVIGVREEDGRLRLRVRHFNGQPWPVEPLSSEVTVLERTYDENAQRPPLPPRRGKLDTQRRLARTVSEHERRERPFDPAAPRESYAKPHHFAVNVRGGGRKDPSWSPNEELWRRRELILPNEADPDSDLKDSVLDALYQWHGGQSSAVYSLASTGHSDLVSRSMIAAAVRELERDLLSARDKDKAHLQALLGELEMILSYPEGASAEEAGMDIEEYEYDTWSQWFGDEMKSNQSRAHLRPDKTFFFVAGDTPGSYSPPYASYVEAMHAKDSLSGSWQGEGVILEVRGADRADARRRASSVHKGYLDMKPNASSGNATQFKHLLFGTRFRFADPAQVPTGKFGEDFEYRKVDHKHCAVAIGEGTGRSKFRCSPDTLVVPIYASNASRGERAIGVLAGEYDPGVDVHAKEELHLFIDNDRRFSYNSPEGIGLAVRENLLKKIKKGTYDHTLAAKGWLHVVDAAAQAYAKEFDDAKRWHVMFNAPTRRAVAREQADAFYREVQAGEIS
jgi:hypothetical protein